MSYEVEQKFRVTDLDAIADQVRGLGGEPAAAIRQVDRYFAHPARDFAHTDEAFRLRQVGNANYVTYKGPKIDQTTKTRREIELPLPDGGDYAGQFAEMLEELGFQPVGAVCKHRQVVQLPWEGSTVEIALDEVDSVGQYVELEVTADEAGLDDARARLASLAAELNLTEVERRSYLELLLDD